jgi:hypothetical protein
MASSHACMHACRVTVFVQFMCLLMLIPSTCSHKGSHVQPGYEKQHMQMGRMSSK